MDKLNLAVICGGRSAEHEVSITSAYNVVQALDLSKYNLQIIVIDKKGFWHRLDSVAMLAQMAKTHQLPPEVAASRVALVAKESGAHIVDLAQKTSLGTVDVAFPVLHGPFGEDGTIQGYFKTINIAYIGAGVLGSAVGMDKDVMKRLLREAGLPIGEFLVIHQQERSQYTFEGLAKRLGSPFFVKSANLGSSIGVHKVQSAQDFAPALDDAFLYDHKVVVEAFIQGREVECSVIGNEAPRASLPGEVRPHHEFYSYEAKYLDANGAELLIPAPLPEAVSTRVRELAVRTFQVLCCEGLGRVDFFVTPQNEVFINEINTLPGFTQISMYPKMWEASGLSYTNLIDELITLAMARFHRDQELRVNRT